MMGTVTRAQAVDSVTRFALELIADPAALSDDIKTRLYQYLMRLKNGSPKALSLAERFASGEIDGDTLLEMMG